ncbi:putative quinol monooxygenase [Zhihengliuella somnathii]
MTTTIVTAVFTPQEGSREELIAALREAIPAVHEEDGCELYAIHDAEDGTITMLEKWTTRAALDAHGVGPAVERLGSLVQPFLAQPVHVTKMTPLPAGTAAQGAL